MKETIVNLKKDFNKLYGRNIFDDGDQAEAIVDNIVDETKETTEPEEGWVWVDGFKGTDKDMRCRDFQYELGKRFDMPDDSKIEECESGFHFCRILKNVYAYYGVENGNRFFQVRGLVRKSDLDKKESTMFAFYNYGLGNGDKLAAKSIELVRELTVDEILEKYDDLKDAPNDVKQLAISNGLTKARYELKIRKLTDAGYSRLLSEVIAENGDADVALKLVGCPELSMDAKVFIIFKPED